MFKLYYAAAIDTCPEKALKQIEVFKELFTHYLYQSTRLQSDGSVHHCVNPIEVYGAGFGDSPVIGPETSSTYKGVLSAYDLRKIRECDVLLVVTDLKQFAAGTFQELEYARNLGIYTIIFVYDEETRATCTEHNNKVKNIFLETFPNKIIYSMEELEAILKDLTQ